jgi:hypothetical protein
MHRLSIRLAALLLLLSSPALAADVSVRLDAGTGFNVLDSAGSTVRLRVDEATGNVSRNGALFVHTTGSSDNLFIGRLSGNPGSSGFANTSLGYGALYYVTTGYFNTAVGTLALVNNQIGGSNSAFGSGALRQNTAGYWNSAFGTGALRSNTTANQNSAFGRNALYSNTTGGANAAFGSYAMRNNITGNNNAAFGNEALQANTASFNSAMGGRALQSNTSGAENAAVGFDALRLNTTGIRNVAMGMRALVSNTTGNYNTAAGWHALYINSNGARNTAVGVGAMLVNQTGFNNEAFGDAALDANVGGLFNVAIGSSALGSNVNGSRNVALGNSAGVNQTSGSDNVYIANQGVAAENRQIKIGTVGTHVQTTIAGISGATSAGGIGVFVNASGVLGTTTSSARFKQDVRDMGDASDVLMRLRPVTFRYTEDAVGAEDAKTPQYGLIAEEVASVAPELVAQDLDGRPYSVKYHELPALLLSHAQKQQRTIEAQASVIQTQRLAIDALSARMARLESEAGAAGEAQGR